MMNSIKDINYFLEHEFHADGFVYQKLVTTLLVEFQHGFQVQTDRNGKGRKSEFQSGNRIHTISGTAIDVYRCSTAQIGVIAVPGAVCVMSAKTCISIQQVILHQREMLLDH